ncbi:uncharacterized protein LOC131877572 isoform X4 [Tigriopus californicus]|uniref:uncharacterized protein LOC131877572 isoform X4 n=1 Tax=Tigriopus californicus TaxID=6832 RepID=UPI0027D9E39B|nr:uncharacterized protein LOC131877572 isoform X4 [Tigriopus californicus]
MRKWCGISTSTLTFQVLLLIVSLSQGSQTMGPLDCRVFPFHPVCRGFNAGKRSATPPEPTSLKTYAPPKDASHASSSSSSSHIEQVAGSSPRPLGLDPECLSPKVYDVLYRKYAFAPKCRGTTSKRSVPNVIPTLESPWMEQNLPDTLGEDTYQQVLESDHVPPKAAIQKRSYGGGLEALPNTFYHPSAAKQILPEEAYLYASYLASLPKYRSKRTYHGLTSSQLFSPYRRKRSLPEQVDQDFPDSFSSIFVPSTQT